MLHMCATLATYQLRVSREIRSRDSFDLHTSWVFFTLSHTQPLHDSQLNTGYLITKIQANLARNKANTWLNKFNLTPPNYSSQRTSPSLIFTSYLNPTISSKLHPPINCFFQCFPHTSKLLSTLRLGEVSVWAKNLSRICNWRGRSRWL